MDQPRVYYLDRDAAAQRLQQVLSDAQRSYGHTAGGVGRLFADINHSRLQPGLIAQRFRDHTPADVLIVELPVTRAIQDRLRSVDRSAIERGLKDAVARTLRERLPLVNAVTAIYWSNDGPRALVTAIPRAPGPAPRLDPADQAALHVAWNASVTRAFRLDRIEAIERRSVENPPQRLVVPVRQIAPDLTAAHLQQPDVRQALFRRVSDFVNGLTDRRPIIELADHDGAQALVIDYNSRVQPPELADRLREHLSPEHPEPAPANRHQYDVIRLQIHGGARAFDDFHADDLRRLLDSSVRKAGNVHPRHALIIAHWTTGENLTVSIVLNPRQVGAARREGAPDPDALRQSLEDRLAQRLTLDALHHDTRQRGLAAVLGPVVAQHLSHDRFQRQEQRREQHDRERAIEHAREITPDPDPTRILRTPDWLRQPLDQFVVRVALGHELLHQFQDPHVQREIVQKALDTTYPAFRQAGIEGNFNLRTGRNGELEVVVRYPRGLIADDTAREWASPAHAHAFARAMVQDVHERSGNIPRELLPRGGADYARAAEQAFDRAAGVAAFGVRTWQRLEYAQYASEDPGRALAGEIKARFGNPLAIKDLVTKPARAVDRIVTALSRFTPPGPVATAVRATTRAASIADSLIRQR